MKRRKRFNPGEMPVMAGLGGAAVGVLFAIAATGGSLALAQEEGTSKNPGETPQVLYLNAPKVTTPQAREAGDIARNAGKDADTATRVALFYATGAGEPPDAQARAVLADAAEDEQVERAVASIGASSGNPGVSVTASAADEAGKVLLAQTGTESQGPDEELASGGEDGGPVRPDLGDGTGQSVSGGGEGDAPTESSDDSKGESTGGNDTVERPIPVPGQAAPSQPTTDSGSGGPSYAYVGDPAQIGQDGQDDAPRPATPITSTTSTTPEGGTDEYPVYTTPETEPVALTDGPAFIDGPDEGASGSRDGDGNPEQDADAPTSGGEKSTDSLEDGEDPTGTGREPRPIEIATSPRENDTGTSPDPEDGADTTADDPQQAAEEGPETEDPDTEGEDGEGADRMAFSTEPRPDESRGESATGGPEGAQEDPELGTDGSGDPDRDVNQPNETYGGEELGSNGPDEDAADESGEGGEGGEDGEDASQPVSDPGMEIVLGGAEKHDPGQPQTASQDEEENAGETGQEDDTSEPEPVASPSNNSSGGTPTREEIAWNEPESEDEPGTQTSQDSDEPAEEPGQNHGDHEEEPEQEPHEPDSWFVSSPPAEEPAPESGGEATGGTQAGDRDIPAPEIAQAEEPEPGPDAEQGPQEGQEEQDQDEKQDQDEEDKEAPVSDPAAEEPADKEAPSSTEPDSAQDGQEHTDGSGPDQQHDQQVQIVVGDPASEKESSKSRGQDPESPANTPGQESPQPEAGRTEPTSDDKKPDTGQDQVRDPGRAATEQQSNDESTNTPPGTGREPEAGKGTEQGGQPPPEPASKADQSDSSPTGPSDPGTPNGPHEETRTGGGSNTPRPASQRPDSQILPATSPSPQSPKGSPAGNTSPKPAPSPARQENAQPPSDPENRQPNPYTRPGAGQFHAAGSDGQAGDGSWIGDPLSHEATSVPGPKDIKNTVNLATQNAGGNGSNQAQESTNVIQQTGEGSSWQHTSNQSEAPVDTAQVETSEAQWLEDKPDKVSRQVDDTWNSVSAAVKPDTSWEDSDHVLEETQTRIQNSTTQTPTPARTSPTQNGAGQPQTLQNDASWQAPPQARQDIAAQQAAANIQAERQRATRQQQATQRQAAAEQRGEQQAAREASQREAAERAAQQATREQSTTPASVEIQPAGSNLQQGFSQPNTPVQQTQQTQQTQPTSQPAPQPQTPPQRQPLQIPDQEPVRQLQPLPQKEPVRQVHPQPVREQVGQELEQTPQIPPEPPSQSTALQTDPAPAPQPTEPQDQPQQVTTQQLEPPDQVPTQNLSPPAQVPSQDTGAAPETNAALLQPAAQTSAPQQTGAGSAGSADQITKAVEGAIQDATGGAGGAAAKKP